jgi:hypothetical protein
MIEDQVREVLNCLQFSGAIFLRAHLTAPWCYESSKRQTLENDTRVQAWRASDLASLSTPHETTSTSCSSEFLSGFPVSRWTDFAGR